MSHGGVGLVLIIAMLICGALQTTQAQPIIIECDPVKCQKTCEEKFGSRLKRAICIDAPLFPGRKGR